MRKLVTMRQALGDATLLADALPGTSWASWRILLIAIVGEALTDDERVVFAKLTGREREPLEMIDTFLAVAGRRSGKSRAMATLITYLACLCDWSNDLSLGERGLALFLAPSERQAAIVFRYASSIIDHVPVLAELVAGRTADTLTLSNQIDLEVQCASWRRSRGATAVAIVLDESAFFHSGDDAANADAEIVVALKPSLATTRGPLLMTSSPSQMEGVVYRTWKRHFGPGGDARIVVVQAESRALNPRLSQAVVDRAYADDAVSAESEYGGTFRQAVSAYLARSIVEKAVAIGVTGRTVLPGVRYVAFVDVAGGSGADSFTLAIGHKQRDQGRDICVVDALLEVRPPFDPDVATASAAELLGAWGVKHVVGDNYAASWPVTSFARHGVGFQHAALTKSQVYLHVLPLFTAARVELLDEPRAIDQLCALKRKVGNGGRETIDHPRGGHDDVANAICGLLWRLSPATRGAVTSGPCVIVFSGVRDPEAPRPGAGSWAELAARPVPRRSEAGP
jgi:hypothetical protein